MQFYPLKMTNRNKFNWGVLILWCVLVPTIHAVPYVNALVGEGVALLITAVAFLLVLVTVCNLSDDFFTYPGNWRLHRRLGRALVRFARWITRCVSSRKSALPVARIVERRGVE